MLEDNSKIPKTGDGYIIYPGMPVYICKPFSINMYSEDTIYCVEKDVDSGEFFVVLEGSRFFNEGCGLWDEGNTSHVSSVFFEKEKCLQEYVRKKNKALLRKGLI